MERKKVLSLRDLVFFSFCAIFGVEAIATCAAIGPSAISWWIICITGYFLPFGLICAELGSAYPEQGGIYVWIKKALGRKWAGRSIWYYWISLPIWLPALYIAIAEMSGHMFFPGIGLWHQVFIGVILIWVAVAINLCPLKVSKWIPNVGSFAQFAIIIGMIAAAAFHFMKNGRLANEINLANVLPNLDAAIVFIPAIIYNLLGCELLSAAAGETKDPARNIPRALILSALVIAFLYLVATFTFWVVVPYREINVASGILQLFTIAFGKAASGVITMAAGLLVSLTFFTGIVAWSLGQNRTVAESAKNGDLPKILGKVNKEGAPVGASVASGIVSTVVIIIYGALARNAGELFWQVISFSLVVGLFSYLMLFPSFIILRTKDTDVVRPYRIPGPQWIAIAMAVLAEMFILISALILVIQPGHDFIRIALPNIAGILIALISGEIIAARRTPAANDHSLEKDSRKK